MRKCLIAGLVLSAIGCHSRSDQHPTPMATLGSMPWKFPGFLQGQFKNLDPDTAEASFDIDLLKDGATKSVHINSGFQVKSCNPVEKASVFVSNFAAESAENIPENLKTDAYELGSWISGRILLQKRYKAHGETGIYRMDALVANENASECVSWNFVFTPSSGTTVEFIEGSDIYLELMDSLAATWAELGADMED